MDMEPALALVSSGALQEAGYLLKATGNAKHGGSENFN